MLFKGYHGLNRLTHRLIGQKQISWSSRQVVGGYCQSSLVWSRVRLELVKGNYVLLSWYLQMYLLVVFIGPTLRFSLAVVR